MGDVFTPVAVTETPVRIQRLDEETLICDFGLDAFGKLALSYTADVPCTVQIAFGEVLLPEGRLNRTPGGARIAHVTTIELPPGNGCVDVPPTPWKPRYTVHPETDPLITPFRYAEINGTARRLEVSRTTYTAPFNDDASEFTCENETLKRVWEFCKYSIKATTVFGVYVDGNRERLPYEGDAYVNQLCHFALDCDYSVAKRTIEFLLVNPTWPTEWRLIMVPIVYDYVMHSGDLDSLARWYEPLQRNLLSEFADAQTELLSTDGAEKIKDIVDWPTGERDGTVFGNVNLVPNCYRLRGLETMALLDGLLGFGDKASEHTRRARILRNSIREHLRVDKKFVDSIGSDHLALHGAVFALWSGAATEPAEIEELKRLIVSKGMACSVYCAQYLLEVCFEYGLEDHAIKLMTDDSKRSWLNMLREGATMTMEAWDNEFKPNQDWNHAWGAAPANIIGRHMFGIRPTEPGFASYTVNPHLGSIGRASYRYPTLRGPITVEIP